MMAEDLNVGDQVTGVWGYRPLAGVVISKSPLLVVIRDETGSEFEVAPAWVDDLKIVARRGDMSTTTAGPAAQTTATPDQAPPAVALEPLPFPADFATPEPPAQVRTVAEAAFLNQSPGEIHMFVKCEVCQTEFDRTANNQVRCAPCQDAYRKKVARIRRGGNATLTHTCRHPGCTETTVGKRYLCPKHWVAKLRQQKAESVKRRARGEYARQAARDAAKIAKSDEDIKGSALNNPAGAEPAPAPGNVNTAVSSAAAAEKTAALTKPGEGGGSPPSGGRGAEPHAVVAPPELELLNCDRCGGYFRHGIDGDRSNALCMKCLHDQEKAAETAESPHWITLRDVQAQARKLEGMLVDLNAAERAIRRLIAAQEVSP